MSNETKQSIVVLDHANEEVFVLPYNPNVHPEAEEYLYEAAEEYEELRYTSIGNCKWQVVTGNFKLTVL